MSSEPLCFLQDIYTKAYTSLNIYSCFNPTIVSTSDRNTKLDIDALPGGCLLQSEPDLRSLCSDFIET